MKMKQKKVISYINETKNACSLSEHVRISLFVKKKKKKQVFSDLYGFQNHDLIIHLDQSPRVPGWLLP